MTRHCADLRRQTLAVAITAISILVAPSSVLRSDDFVRGDADADGQINLTDAVYLLGCLFLGTECASCSDAGDTNDDGSSNLADPIYLLNFLFLGGPTPPDPGGSCGADPTDDTLDCASFTPCPTVSNPDAIPTSAGELEVVPIEHGSVAMRWNGLLIHADPVGSAAQFEGLTPADIIVVTHAHGDHLDATTLRRLVGEDTVLVMPESVASALARSGILDTVDARVLANDETTQIGDDVIVRAIPMYNLSPDRERFHRPGVGNSYVLEFAGTRVYVSGDTEDIPEMRALEDIALAFLCMNLPFTMTPEQAASAALDFLPRVVYPYHYRDQDPEVFRSIVEEGTSEVEVRLRNWYP